MKPKLIITFALLLLFGAIAFMIIDFLKNDKGNKNPYEYNLDNFKKVDSSQICYEEKSQIIPDMEKLRGIAIDVDDNVYITGKSKLFIYDKNGNIKNEFNLPEEARNIAVSKSKEIYLGVWDHVEVYDTEGNLLRKWNKLGEKSIITSIALTDKEVFIADFGHKIIYRCDFEGNIINQIGAKDTLNEIPGFFVPSPYFDVALGRDGELWAVNPGYHKFEAYDFQGNLISTWKRTSMQLDGFSGCCNPSHIAILPNGSFVTSEKGIERVKIHSPSGDFICVVAGPDKFDEGTIGLDLAIDSKQNIYVLDPKKGMVRVFKEVTKVN